MGVFKDYATAHLRRVCERENVDVGGLMAVLRSLENTGDEWEILGDDYNAAMEAMDTLFESERTIARMKDELEAADDEIARLTEMLEDAEEELERQGAPA